MNQRNVFAFIIILNVFLAISFYSNGVTVIFNIFERYTVILEDNKQLQKLEQNERPIIGILSQELSTRMVEEFKEYNYTSYIAASYVKFVESAGARVIPVLINQTHKYYEVIAKSVNGFVFPGGSLYFTSKYSEAVKKILQLIKGNVSIPLWATCLGFENLIYFESGMNENVVSRCNASNTADKLVFTNDAFSSKLFGSIPSNVMKNFATKNITSNFHHNCVLPKNFYDAGLNDSYKITSTSFDKTGVEYISTVEHRTLPIFGLQWHPEKPAFEWADDPKHDSIPHSYEAIQASQSVADVFVQYARKNFNKFASKSEERKHLIYNYSAVYVAGEYVSSFVQCYFFK